MNSFRFVERGIAAEIERQKGILDGGGTVEQETLHFDPRSGELTPLRSKEYSHDYRYFPEPDLVPLAPTEEMIASARAALPELPAERRERYARARACRGAGDPARVRLRARRLLRGGRRAAPGVDAATVANWVTSELPRRSPTAGRRPPDPSAGAPRRERSRWSRRSGSRHGAARQLLRVQVVEDVDPEALAEREGLGGIEESGELEAIVAAAIEADPAAAEKVRDGQHEGGRPARRLRHARDQGPRRRRRGHAS